MLTFLKAQVSAIIGSVADFLIYILLVQLTDTTPRMVVLATIEGAVCGGIVNFIISRSWVFNEGRNNTRVQIMRYLLVWAGSIALNAAGMHLFKYYTTVNYIIARIIVSVVVGVFYNYFLQKRFVFK